MVDTIYVSCRHGEAPIGRSSPRTDPIAPWYRSYTPPPRCRRSSRLFPFHPRAAEPLFDDHLAGRFRHAAPDWFLVRHSRRVVHSSCLRLVPKVCDRPLHILVHLWSTDVPSTTTSTALRSPRASRLVFELMTTLVHPRLARRGLATVDHCRRFAQVLRRVPKVHDLGIGMPFQEFPVPFAPSAIPM